MAPSRGSACTADSRRGSHSAPMPAAAPASASPTGGALLDAELGDTVPVRPQPGSRIVVRAERARLHGRTCRDEGIAPVGGIE
jgi:hypothetical protein